MSLEAAITVDKLCKVLPSNTEQYYIHLYHMFEYTVLIPTNQFLEYMLYCIRDE